MVDSEPDGVVLCMQLTQSDALLLTGSQGGALRVVCTQTGDVERSVSDAHQSAVTSIVINSADTVLATGQCLRPFIFIIIIIL